MKNQQVICITGMHRSGTSLAASWLEICGLNIHNGSFWGSGPGNPKGHFEDKDFVALHDSAIKSEKSTSKGWIIFTAKPLFFNTDQHLSQALKLIEIRNTKYKIWGWKDPRTSLFLEQWKKILPSLKVIMLWRPCEEVINSLIRRSKKTKIEVMKIGGIKSVLLWNSYNSHLINYKMKYPQDTLLFSLKNIINNDSAMLNHINSKFKSELDYIPIEAIFDQKLLTFDSIPTYCKLLSRVFGSEAIEKKMADLSEQLESL